MRYQTFTQAIADTKYALEKRSKIVHPNKWQGKDVSQSPEMATHELLHHSIRVNMGGMRVPSTAIGGTLGTLQQDINPNLPWADNHFEERVCGAPINPGVQWAHWPFGLSAQKFLDDEGKFNHNYMERYWPKQAGGKNYPTATPEQFWDLHKNYEGRGTDYSMRGIRYEYGDLDDVVNLLCGDPLTRQAYLPVWFPEDTGGGDKRAPCTLGYHFIMRDSRLDITYYIRSCDYLRHFRDDIYLTVRLLLWVLDRCRERSNLWDDITPGDFLMHVTSLHIFRNDYRQLFE